ncbi:hypothetical protein HK096_000402, partial [Nowakowskiella sp. JEL0078]
MKGSNRPNSSKPNSQKRNARKTTPIQMLLRPVSAPMISTPTLYPINLQRRMPEVSIQYLTPTTTTSTQKSKSQSTSNILISTSTYGSNTIVPSTQNWSKLRPEKSSKIAQFIPEKRTWVNSPYLHIEAIPPVPSKYFLAPSEKLIEDDKVDRVMEINQEVMDKSARMLV